MYASALRRLLELYPAGASSDQLLWRLKVSGSRASAADVLQGLQELSGNGEVRIATGGRWTLSRLQPGMPGGGVNARSGSVAADGRPQVLRAAYATVSRLEAGSTVVANGEPDALTWRMSDHWRELLAYYAATQRADPRGKITQHPDRHGIAWHLFACTGDWWQEARLSFSLADLSEGFREALLKRPEKICALGYPLTLVETATGTDVIPALLLPATWTSADETLHLDVAISTPVINPDWLKSIAGQVSWKADDLEEVLLPQGEAHDLDGVVRRLRQSLARFGGGGLAVGRLDRELTLARAGLHNAAAIFLSADRSYTQGTARDLTDLIDAGPQERAATALAALLSDDALVSEPDAEVDVLQLRDLTEHQFGAALSVLSAPLTLIEGPPGTGKSDLIVSVIASAVAAGESVLFASRNHQALDEVERRLQAMTGDVPVITRGRDAEGDRDTNFLAELKLLAASEPWPTHRPSPDGAGLLEARQASRAKLRRRHRTTLELKLARALDRLERLPGAPPEKHAKPKREGWLARVVDAVLQRRSHAGRVRSGDIDTLGPDVPPETFRRYVDALRREAAAMAAADGGPPPFLDEESIARLIEALGPVLERRTMPDEETRTRLRAGIKELEFSGITKSRRLVAEDARILLRHRPVWAVSTLSVPSRVPLVPGLFDLLVIDEASQCDVASALPLFYRARRAAVVGDPMQLSFVPQLSVRQEHALMNAAGLPGSGRAQIAQSINSLFDFASTRPGAVRHFLADQFRSAPGIVDYLNAEFYRGRLAGRREDDDLVKAPGYKPGLAWADVKGRASRVDDQNLNEAEAEEVVRRVAALARDPAFSGSIGVLSPFVGQVEAIRRRAINTLSPEERERVKLKVATIDKFQGGEADVVFFSLVLAEGAGFGVSAFLRRESRRFNVAVSRARAVCVVVGDLAFARASDIPHVRSLARHATEPRTRPRETFDSTWERRLFVALQQHGLDPQAQYAIGRRHLDIALFHGDVKLDVEVDGRAYHTDPDGNRKIGDLLRDRELIARGWKVRRFWVSELDQDMENCLDLINADLGRP